MGKVPDRLFVKKEDHGDFKLLQEAKDSAFYKRGNKEVFIMAMIMGLKQGSRISFQTKQEFVREEYLNDDERILIRAIAVAEEKTLSVLLDMTKVYQIAEEYAAGGIKILKEAVFTQRHGSYIKRLESELIEDFERYVSENTN